jgi:prepilin-type N-terminal cleavage/methylation domain-containing protein
MAAREGEAGFSLVEMMVAMTIMLVVTGTVFTLMNPSHGTFATEPEVADMQQRLRVASDVLYKDLVMTGAGAYSGNNVGTLTNFFAPILPLRSGSVNDDPPGTYRTDTVTLYYVPATSGQTTISHTMPGQSTELKVNDASNCPQDVQGQKQNLCGFVDGQKVLVYDENGNYAMYTITEVQDAAAHIQVDKGGDTGWVPPIGSKVVSAYAATYYLKTDDTNGVYQLMFYDGGSNPDVAVVDDVVGLTFEYYGEPQPPQMKKPLSDPTGPWTTYGPRPSAVPVAPYAAGENCVFINDGSPTPAPRLGALGAAGSGLVKLTQAQLTDGPWCPNSTREMRWDADLLRIRKIAVTLRVQAAVKALRGPASSLFTHGGTSRSGNKWAPDQEVRFQVTPRNLNLGR